MNMPAGTYYIGDLCYVMHDVWREVCNLSDSGYGKFTLKDGREFAIFPTKYGDGTYDGLSVDSGTLGCIKVDDIRDTTYSGDHLNGLAKVVMFLSDFEVSEDNGVIQFGHVSVDTDPEEEEDEFYGEWDE